MPGMMDTVLNLGLNDTVVKGFAAKAGDRFAYDCYRRFLDMYGNVVLGFQHSDFEKHLTAIKVLTPLHEIFAHTLFWFFNHLSKRKEIWGGSLKIGWLKSAIFLHVGNYFPMPTLLDFREGVKLTFEQ